MAKLTRTTPRAPASSRARRRRVTAGLIGLLSSPFAVTVTAQAPAPPNPDGQRSAIEFHRSFAVPDNRTAYDTYDEALRGLAENRFAAALPKLQRILDQYANKVVNVPLGDGEQTRYHGYGVEVNRLLSDLPDNGKRIYREIYDGPASKLFTKARSARDAAALLDVVRRYRHTSSGDAAIEALGDLYLERGEAWNGAYFYSLLDQSARGRATPDAAREVTRLTKHVYALALCGRVEEAKARGAQLAEQSGSKTIAIGDRVLTIEDAIARWSDSARIADPVGHEAATAGQDSTGDDGSRYPGEGVESPLVRSLASVRHCEWKVAIPVLHELEIAQYGTVAAPFLPVAGRGKIFVQNGLKVWAYNLSDGALRWRYGGVLDRATDQPNPRLLFSGTLDRGRFFTNLEVFVEAPEHYYHAIPIQKKIPMRKLFAFDADTGDVAWTHAPGKVPTSVRPADRDFLARTNVSSPPIAWEDSVLCGMSFFEGKIYCYLTALDSRTGGLRWRTLLCTGQKALNMFGRPVREPVLGIPAVADGVAYFTTNLGVVAAVDARTGETLWLSTYKQRDVQRGRGMMMRDREPAGWHVAPTMVRDGVVVTAPMDADHLFGFDAKTGRMMWKVSRHGDAITLDHLIGIDGATVYASGSGVAAYHLKTGLPRWPSAPFDRQEQTSWRGVIMADGVVVPTEKHLHMIRKRDGARVINPPIAWDAPIDHSGNLVMASRDTFITAGRLAGTKSAYLNVFYDRRERIRRLERTVAANPEDVAARLALARTLAQGGMIEHSLATFDSALTQLRGQTTFDARRLALEALRGRYDVLSRLASREMREQRWAAAEKIVDRALESADGQPFHLSAMLVKEQLLRKQGKRDAFAAFYRDLGQTFGERRHAFPDWGNLPVALYARLRSAEAHRDTDPKVAVQLWQDVIQSHPDVRLAVEPPRTARVHAIAMIDELIRKDGRAAYASFDEHAAGLYRSGTERGDLDALRAVIIGFPNATVIEPALLAYAVGCRKAGRSTEAVRTLRQFLGRTRKKGNTDPRAIAELVLAYGALGYRHAAREIAARLVRHHADASFEIDGEAITGRAFVATHSKRNESGTQAFNDQGTTAPTLRWNDIRPNHIELELIRLARHGSPRKLLVLTAINRDTGAITLEAVEPGESPRRIWSVKLPDGVTRSSDSDAALIDGTLVLPADSHVLAFDANTGGLRWTRSYQDRQVDGIAVAEGAAIVVASPPSFTAGDTVRRKPVIEAVELATGEAAWRHTLDGGYPLAPRSLTGHTLITMRRKPTAVHVYDTLTGIRRRTFPLADRFLAIDPAITAARDVMMSTDSRTIQIARRLDNLGGIDGAKSMKPETIALAAGELETLIGTRYGALVVSAIKTEENADGGGFRHRQRVQMLAEGAPRFRWTVELDDESILDAGDLLSLPNRWILPTRDLEGRVSLRALDHDGKSMWALSELFDRNTFQTPLYRIRGGILAIGHDPTARRDTSDAATTQLVVLTTEGKKRTQWAVKESAKPKGAWATDEGFFLLWPHRIEYYGTTPRESEETR